MLRVSTGMLNGEIPYLAVGDGPPLVMAMGLTATHEIPTGWERRMALRSAMPLSSDFRVYVVNQKPGLRLGESISGIAGHLVTAIEKEIGEPVLLTGTSTGGSVAFAAGRGSARPGPGSRGGCICLPARCARPQAAAGAGTAHQG